jgi:hypothetical protein
MKELGKNPSLEKFKDSLRKMQDYKREDQR